MLHIENVNFNNGQSCPILGLGTWKSNPGDVERTVRDAIDLGYRHFDCAPLYGNENEVGSAITAKIDEGSVTRRDLFITSKLWGNSMRPDLVEPALRRTLKDLGTDFVDLYLVHAPTAIKEGEELLPWKKNGQVEFSDVDYVDTWKAVEEICEKGLAKSIGVSNFNKGQIERLLNVANILPVTNQIECHPYLNQKKLMAFCKSKDIVTTAYSPLGSPDRPWADPNEIPLLKNPTITEIASKYGKTVAQVLLKYQIQRGNIVIPKTVTRSRMMENAEIFNFVLSEDDIVLLDTLDYNKRFCPFVFVASHKHFPFNEEY